MTRYMMMPIGRVNVVLIYDGFGVLCVQRTKWDARKLRLNRKWWVRANAYLHNAHQPVIEGGA